MPTVRRDRAAVMTRFALSYLGAVLCIAFVIDRWLHRRYPEPPPWEEPEEGVQPPDPRPVYLVTLGRGDPRIGTWSRN
jgi:hypothetical protein